jgi:hypothetical protein
MLFNYTDILTCGTAHKGRDRDQTALKQHASKLGEQILPKKIVEASLPFPERKKAGDVFQEWNSLAPVRQHNINNTDAYKNMIHHYPPSMSQRETLYM